MLECFMMIPFRQVRCGMATSKDAARDIACRENAGGVLNSEPKQLWRVQLQCHEGTRFQEPYQTWLFSPNSRIGSRY